jgi:hypothetical protein
VNAHSGKRRRRSTAVTVPIAIETTREIAAARWAALATTGNDSPHPTQAATVTPPDA